MNRFLKTFALSVSAAALAVSLCACSGGNSSSVSESSSAESAGASSENNSASASETAAPSAVTDAIMNDIGIKFPGMAEVKEDRFDQYYDIDIDKVESFSAYICGSGAYPDELAVFKMKSESDISAAKTALEARIETLTKTYEDYKPDEMYKIDNKNIVSKGCYIAVIVCSDNASAIAEFEKKVG